MNFNTIPEQHQESVLSSFWTMLRELENKANNDNDPVLKHWVAQWYSQWNEITGQNHLPRWEKP